MKILSGNSPIERKVTLCYTLMLSIVQDRIKRLNGFKQKQGPINYLGFPLFVERPRNIYFSNLASKVVGRITGWQTKQLCDGGKEVLTKHVLQALLSIYFWH